VQAVIGLQREEQKMQAPSGRELAFAAAGAVLAGVCVRALSSSSAADDGAPEGTAGPEESAVDSSKTVESRSRESETMLIPVERLKKFTSDVFVHCGCLKDEAALAAEVLILADHRGIDSHGVARLHAYFTLLEAGEINPRPNVRKITSTSTTATVDGDNGLGLIVGPKANAIAMEMAEQHGSGWVSVKNTNHYGIAGFYSLQAVERDMIGFSMTTSSAVVAPLWGKRRMLGTNPIAVAFPGTDGVNRPIVVDFATSVVPWGKIEEHARMGKALLDGWAIDPDGGSAMVPEDVLGSGALMNLGGDRDHSGHKGYIYLSIYLCSAVEFSCF
jgi:L-2-hydroxycarboxylate dehydrogenase (NAD+)